LVKIRLRSHGGRIPLLCPLWVIRTSPLRPRHGHFKLKSRHTQCRHRCRLPDRERSNKRLEDPRPIQKLQGYREMGPAYLPGSTAITCLPQFISGRDLSRSRVPKVEKICRRPRLPARTRRRYISYRRTERSVPDGGLTSCRTSFALHVFGRTDRLKQSPVPTRGTWMLVVGRKMTCVTYADTLGSHRLVANATEVSNTSTAGGGWARG